VNNSIVYIETIEEIIDLHRRTVYHSGGGSLGVLNTHSIEAALEHVQNDDYYPDFVSKLTYLVYIANKSHCFQDGNKRIAISIGILFLLKNGRMSIIQKFAHKMEMVSYQLAAGRIEKELLNDIIKSIVLEEDYSEELKLRILLAIKPEEDSIISNEKINDDLEIEQQGENIYEYP
jgi:death-on-curing protein